MNNESVQKILEEIKNTRDELRDLILASETHLLLNIEEQKNKIASLEGENKELKHKVERLERDLKENNIVICQM